MNTPLEWRIPPNTTKIGKINIEDKKLLIPDMNHFGSRLFAATARSFGIPAMVLETYKGLGLGMKYTSGKECFPCQVTLGDILYFISNEQKQLGNHFRADNYVYFLPESAGPCRFGVYNSFQRIVFNSLPGLDKLSISSLTTEDGYSLAGMVADDRIADFRKAAFLSVISTDILERLLWRIRPYEKKAGMADKYIEFALDAMIYLFEKYGASNEFRNILNGLEAIIKEGLSIINPDITRKPLIGIVGEIFLRMHSLSNQNLIKRLEYHGAEVVNASFAEWVNYVSYEGMKRARKGLSESVRGGRLTSCSSCMKDLFTFGLNYYYQESRLRRFYRRARKIIDLAPDHNISALDQRLRKEDTYSFEIGTETGLSIAAALEFAHHGFSGVVNVYPFTCMPGMTTSAILKPLLKDLDFPYLDIACDASIQPGREAAIRTFMYQAYQHKPLN